MSSIELRVPTPALRRFLEDTPDLILKLESMTTEKIAEEIFRKVIKTDTKSAEREMINRIIAEAEKTLTATWRFPTQAKNIIAELVEAELKRQQIGTLKQAKVDIVNAVQDTAKSLQTNLLNALNTEFEKRRVTLAAEIKKQAREEFLSVLAEARANITA